MSNITISEINHYLLKRLHSVERQNMLALDQLVATNDDIAEIVEKIKKWSEN